MNNQTVTENDKLISLDGAADRLGVSVWTVRAWARESRITTVKLGSRRLIPKSEIDRIVVEGLPERTKEQAE